jgi:RNase H-like domain found in reverse transcriptase
MKTIVAREVQLAYPIFLLPFEINTDASHLQLGVVILQQGKPISFYGRKLNPSQTRYTSTERELLSIVETLKEFCNILLGYYPLIVYTDHRNLMCKKFNTERVMSWHQLLEDFGPELCYIQGEHYIVADVCTLLRNLFLIRRRSTGIAKDLGISTEHYPP